MSVGMSNASLFSCRNYILPQDLIGFLPADKVDNAFEMLDMDGDGKVSLQDIRDAVLQLYKVCFLSSTLHAGLARLQNYFLPLFSLLCQLKDRKVLVLSSSQHYSEWHSSNDI